MMKAAFAIYSDWTLSIQQTSYADTRDRKEGITVAVGAETSILFDWK